MQTWTVSTLRFCRRSWVLKIHFRWNICAFSEVIRLFQSVWLCKKQTSVSHSSSESEVISSDAGLRLDGIPALDLWDLIVAVLHGNAYQSNQELVDPDESPPLNKFNVDFISSNDHSSRKEAMLYIFEDNEAVIKMIIKERSPTLRHVSRTHSSSTECSKVMSKRMQKDAGEERVTAKSEPVMHLVSRYSVRDPNVLASTASESPGETRYESRKRASELVKMCSKQEQGYLCWALAHQTTQNGTLTTIDLLKSGNLVECCDQERRDPYLTSCSSMMIWTLTPPQNRTFLSDHDHSWTQ